MKNHAITQYNRDGVSLANAVATATHADLISIAAIGDFYTYLC